MKERYIKPFITVEEINLEYGVMGDMSYYNSYTEEPQLAKPGFSGGVFEDYPEMSNYPDCLWDD